MYFRFQQQQSLLQINDNFAHLVEIDNQGNMLFEFTYVVPQLKVVAANALTVNVSVETRQFAPKRLLGTSSRGNIDVRGLIANVQTAITDAKSTLQQRLKYTIATRVSDITAGINNEIVPQLRGRASVKDVPYFTQPTLSVVPAAQVKQTNDPQPVLHLVTNTLAIADLPMILSSSKLEDPQMLIDDMITRQGLDPTYIFQLASRSSSEHATRGGMLSPHGPEERSNDLATRLLHYFLFPLSADMTPTSTDELSDSDQVTVLQPVTDDGLEITVPVTILRSLLKREGGSTATQLHVTFDLIDSDTNLAIDSVTKPLDITKHVRIYYTPKIAPSVKVVPSSFGGYVNLEIKQLDKTATEIDVFKKHIWIASTDVDDYQLIGQYSLTSHNQPISIRVEQPQTSPVIYRVVPRGKQSILSSEFTNVVVKPARYYPIKSISLTAHQVDNGMQLEVRNLPSKVVAIQFLRWNLTTFDDSYTTVGTDVSFIDDATRIADMLMLIDSDVMSNNTYRYQARLIFKDGHTDDYADATIEFIEPEPGQVTTTITNLLIDYSSVLNVKFSIQTTAVDTDIDVFKKMLDAQGLTQYFTGDIANQRDELQRAIAHLIYRVDLTAGARECFGIFSTNDFDDAALRNNQAVQPLEYGHNYRYEIYPLLRAPETLLDSFIKTLIDDVTKKQYSFHPAKFLHPYALDEGVLVTSAGARLRYAKDPMAYGTIGAITMVEVSFDESTFKIIDATASNFDRLYNLVTWRFQGDINKVDHFLVMKDVHGIRTLLGKVHAEFFNNVCQYVHTISSHDAGSLCYVIVPVYNDYQVGSSVTTNALTVEAP